MPKLVLDLVKRPDPITALKADTSSRTRRVRVLGLGFPYNPLKTKQGALFPSWVTPGSSCTLLPRHHAPVGKEYS